MKTNWLSFQMKIWSSHLLDNLSNCLMNLKNSGDATGFEPMTSAMPVQCSNQLSYEVTQMRAGQFVGLVFSRERNVVWKKRDMKCGVWNQMKIWSSHLHLHLHLISNTAFHITFLTFFCCMNLKIKVIKIKKYLFINDKCYIWGYDFYSNLKAKFSFRSWTTTGVNSGMKLSKFVAIICYLLKT